MSRVGKRQITKVLPDFTYVCATAYNIIENMEGMHNFSVAIYTSATYTITYDIATAPLLSAANWNLYTTVTGTGVVGTATGIANIHTFDGNNLAWMKITFSGSASESIAAGGIRVYVTYSER